MRFDALEVAFEFAQAAGPLIKQVAQHDRDLAIQLRRAAASVASNFSEGAQRIGADRLQHYRIAAGSAAEARVQLRLAVAWGYIDRVVTEPSVQLADRLVGLGWALTHRRKV